MKRESINFSVALFGVLLAHAALLWVWPIDPPVIAVRVDGLAPNQITNVAILKPDTPQLKEPQPTSPVAPSPVSPVQLVPLQAAVDKPSQPIAPLPLNTNAVHVATTPLQIPASARLHYTLTKGGSSANVLLAWQTKQSEARQTTSYELSLEASSSLFTLLKQTSTGDVMPSGLAPTRYTDKRLRKSEQATHFDADLGTVSFSNNRPQAAWLLGAQDRLSVLVQLAALAQGKANASASINGAVQGAVLKHWLAGEMIQIPVASTDELELWQWEVQPPAQGDAEDSVRLLRRPRRAFDISIELWLSPQLGYLPSRIRQTDSSGVTEQVLTQAERL